jgi:hypothetical protein
MSNLKSKFLLGVMTVAIMFVGVAFVNANKAAAASCTITSTLKVGSKGTQVKCLQSALGITADGSFGPKTAVAVKAWQKTNDLTADGVFGAKSRAALAGSTVSVGTFPAGCNSASGFSGTTGQPCSGATSFPAGCSSAVGFSSTTGASCATSVALTFPAGCTSAAGFSPTTGASCSTGVVTGVSSTGEGSMTLQSAPVTLTTNVGAGDVKDNIMAVGIKATGSNITVNRFNVSLNSSISALPWNYLTTLYLYANGNLIGTMPVNSSTLTQNTFAKDYTVSFDGLSTVVPVNTTVNFAVAADVAGTLPSTGVTYTVGLNDQSTSNVIRGTDGIGLSEYEGATTAYNQTILFSATGNGSLEIMNDASNPSQNNIVENTNQSTLGQTALAFDLQNTSNNPVTIESVSATINNTSSTNPGVSAYYLYNGSTQLQGVGNPGSVNGVPVTTLSFNNFTAFTIAPNSTSVMYIKFDAVANAGGVVNVTNPVVTAMYNSTLITPTGTAQGNNLTLISTGVAVNLTNYTTAVVPNTTGVTGSTSATFNFTVKPVGVSILDLQGAGNLTFIGTNTVNPVITVDNDNVNGVSNGNTATVHVTFNHPNNGAGTQIFSIASMTFKSTATGNPTILVNSGLSNFYTSVYSGQ